jgi:exodeoxyribonuclease VIII
MPPDSSPPKEEGNMPNGLTPPPDFAKIKPEECEEIGMWAGIPEDVYRRLPGLNKSRLNTLVTKTAKRFFWETQHPDKVTTRTMELGTAAHFAVLEPDRFPKLYMRSPDPPCENSKGELRWDRRLKVHAAAWTQAQLAAGGRELLNAEEYDMATGIAASCQEHQYMRDYVANGIPEVSIQWRDLETSLLFKGRLDLWVPSGRFFLDIKTTKCANFDPFGRDAYKMGYHMQMDMYQEGVKAVSGYPPEEIQDPRMLAVENVPPYDLILYYWPPERLELGRYAFHDIALAKLIPCLASGRWPGYPDGEHEIVLPAWAGHEIAKDTDTSLVASEPCLYGEGVGKAAKRICEACNKVIFERGQKIWHLRWRETIESGGARDYDQFVCLRCGPGHEEDEEDEVLAL